MFKYKNITLFVFVILISSLTSHLAYAFPFFEYEIWMQAETSLDIGQIEVQGAIVNMGSAPLDLTAQWGALGGLPSNLNETTPGLEYVHQQLNGNILN